MTFRASARLWPRSRVFCPKFYERRSRLHAGQLLDKVEGGVGVRVSEFDDLVVTVLHTLNRLRIADFDEIGCFSRGCVY
jgi:hypothetical protein